MDWWQSVTTAAWLLLERHGQLAAFFFLLIEEAGTPVPIPGDFLMVVAGVRASQGRVNLVEIILVMELATILGASFLYWISARAGRRVVYRIGKHVGLTPARLDRAAEELNRRGARAVVIGRLTPGLRMATPIICGVLRFPFRIYLPAMALGGFLYLLVYTLLGYVFGAQILRLLETIELPLGLIVSGAMLGGLVYWTLRVGRAGPPPARCPELRERLWAGAASGLVGTLVSSLLANVLIHLFGLLAYQEPGAALAALTRIITISVLRSPGVFVAWLLVPAVLVVGAAFGALYGAWLGNASYTRGPLQGVVFALLPLAGSLLGLMPLLGVGLAGFGLGAGPVPLLGETVRHLAFGLVLGTLYPALARPRKARREVEDAAGQQRVQVAGSAVS